MLATDINTEYLTDLPPNVEVRRHDLTSDTLSADTYGLVHVRALLEHLSDPNAAFSRLVEAVAPGGWLVVEGNDLGLFTMAGSPDAVRATTIMRDLASRWTAAGVLDAFYGRQVPGRLWDLGLDGLAFDSPTGIGARGDPVYETMRLAWPALRVGAAAVGIEEVDLATVDRAFESSSTLLVAMTLFAAWGRKPR